MPKILLPTVDYSPKRGGVARYLHAIKQTFPEDVEVLYWSTPIGRLDMLRELVQFGKDYEQIWVSHILPIGTLAYLAKKVTKTPYVIFLHGMDFDLARRNEWKRVLTKKILRGAKTVVTNSQALADEVAKFAGIKTPLVVYPSIADQFLQEALAFDVQKKKLHLEGPVRLLTVSRLVSRKGHTKVLEAIQHLPNVEYWIAGEGAYEKNIRMRAKDLNLQDRVKMLGNVPDDQLAKLYEEADVFVMPTTKTSLDREGFGIVYLEAQLFGVPVIASNHPGVNEAVEDRVSGFLVRDVASLRSSIKKLADDADLRRTMGQAGRDFVLNRFTREKQCEKLRKLI